MGVDLLTDTEGDAAYAPIAEGVPNGDSHDHSGGDGAQIDYTGLSNLPTIPTQSSLGVDDLITLSGVAEGATSLGTFTGSTITDNQTVKAAVQELETALEGVSAGAVTPAALTDASQGVCDSASSTAYDCDTVGGDTPTTGDIFYLSVDTDSTGTGPLTLDINGVTENVVYPDGSNTASGSFCDESVPYVYYDGTNWVKIAGDECGPGEITLIEKEADDVATPSAGEGTIYFDDDNLRGESLDENGRHMGMVLDVSCSAGDFVDDITAGVPTCDTPSGSGSAPLAPIRWNLLSREGDGTITPGSGVNIPATGIASGGLVSGTATTPGRYAAGFGPDADAAVSLESIVWHDYVDQTITAMVYWTTLSTNTGNVNWVFNVWCHGDGDDGDTPSLGSPQDLIAAHNGTSGVNNVDSLTLDLTGCAADDVLTILFWRDGDDATNDTNTATQAYVSLIQIGEFD